MRLNICRGAFLLGDSVGTWTTVREPVEISDKLTSWTEKDKEKGDCYWTISHIAKTAFRQRTFQRLPLLSGFALFAIFYIDVRIERIFFSTIVQPKNE